MTRILALLFVLALVLVCCLAQAALLISQCCSAAKVKPETTMTDGRLAQWGRMYEDYAKMCLAAGYIGLHDISPTGKQYYCTAVKISPPLNVPLDWKYTMKENQ